MAYTLNQLIDSLKTGAYTPKTEAELQGVADRRYQSYYDQQRLGAQQAAETTGLALDRQLGDIAASYGKQKQATAQQYQQASSDLGRQILGRGMGRSSYGISSLGNMAIAGNKAQQEIGEAEQRAVGGVQDQQTLLARQLSDQLRQYSASQAADVLSYIDELESKEYDRGTSARQYDNSLAMQIYQFANQKEQQDEASQQWLKQFDESIRQYNTSLAQESEQFNKNYDLNKQQMAEQQRQYDLNYNLNLQQAAESKRQFEASLSEQQRQYDQSTAQGRKEFEASLSLQQRQLEQQIKNQEASLSLEQQQLEEQKRQFELGYALDKQQADTLYPAAATSTGGNGKNENALFLDPLWKRQGFKSYVDAQKARALGLSSSQYYSPGKDKTTKPPAVPGSGGNKKLETM